MMNNPPIPPVDNVSALVSWFFKYDDHCSAFRETFSEMREIISEKIVNEIKQNFSRQALHMKLIEIEAEHTAILESIYKSQNLPVKTEEDQEYVLRFYFMEATDAVRLRIIAYILKQKYGMDPKELMSHSNTTDQKLKASKYAKNPIKDIGGGCINLFYGFCFLLIFIGALFGSKVYVKNTGEEIPLILLFLLAIFGIYFGWEKIKRGMG